MTRTLVILLGALVALSTLGCPSKTDKTDKTDKTGASKTGETAEVDDGPGGSSPEDLWEKMKACEGEGGKIDMGKLVPLCTKDSQTQMVTFAMMAAGFATMGKNMKVDPAKEKLLYDMLEKRGLERGADGKVEIKDKAAIEKLKDKAGLCVALFAFADEHGSGKSSDKRMGELKEIKTDGDRATVSLTKKNSDGKDEPDVCVFLKQDGRWYLDLDETKKATKALKAKKK